MAQNSQNFQRDSTQLLSALLAEIPYIERLYNLIGLDIKKNNETNLGHITTRFTSPSAIISVGVLTICYIIQRNSYREYDVITIGKEAAYRRLKATQLESIIYKNLNSNECIQSPLYKKLVFITDIKEMCGTIAYCKTGNQLIMEGNPLKLGTHPEVINCKKTILKFLETRKRCDQ